MTDPIELPSGVGRLTDLGNAHRLAATSGDSLRYAPGIGWLTWPSAESAAWTRDESAAVRFGEAAVREFLLECEGNAQSARENLARVKKKDLASDHPEVVAAKGILDASLAAVAFARRSQKVAQVRAMLEWCGSFENIRIEPKLLDTHPHLLATPRGTIDLRDGSIRPASKTDLISRATTVPYMPDDDSVKKDADEWDAYVHDLIRDNETVEWLHVWAGYCLTGTAREEKFCIIHGPPGDGKGTFVEALSAALGPDLSAALNPDMFAEKKGGGSKPWSLARLQGVRLARFSEADGTSRLSSSLLCRVTGGEVVEAEAKFLAPFDYKPEWKLMFTANDLPRANPDSKRNGLWRRLALIPARRPSSSEEDQDSRVKARWTDPAGGARGVLLWAARGAARYYSAGKLPTRSQAMLAAMERYRIACDPLGQFLDDTYAKVEQDATTGAWSYVDRDELYRAFQNWCIAQGERYPASSAEVKARLADPPWSIDCVRSRHGCGKAYRGLRRLDEQDKDEDERLAIQDPANDGEAAE